MRLVLIRHMHVETLLSSMVTVSGYICRWKSGGYPPKGETIHIVSSKDARPAAEYQNKVSEFSSSRRGGLQKGAQKVLARFWMCGLPASWYAVRALLPGIERQAAGLWQLAAGTGGLCNCLCRPHHFS